MRYLMLVSLFILGTGCVTSVAPVEIEPRLDRY